MPIIDHLIRFARDVRADRRANPRAAGDGTALELLIAPRYQTLVENCLRELTQAPLRVLPEYRRGGVGRPDIAFALPGVPARAFIELKEPNKSIVPAQLQGHDRDQFRRFCELPVWALTNFSTIRLFRREELVDHGDVMPFEALDPDISDRDAENLIRQGRTEPFERVLRTLSMAQAPAPRNAAEVSDVLAHAARLVREVVRAACQEGLIGAVEDVRSEFNETLFARAEAGGYDVRDMDQLFSSAFAQTLVFGLLLARDAGGGEDVDHDAYTLLPEETYPLLRGTLRALTLEEVRDMLGVSFDVTVDTVNSIVPRLLAPRHGRDPMLYLYEDFLRVFDPDAVAKYGVYYTPPEVVQLMVAETDRVLRDALGTDGLLDESVQLLDPACGTGTFLIGAGNRAAEIAEERFGPGMVGPQISAFAQRMFGFELLVGPYTVAHYRMAREVLNRGGGVAHIPIYLTDTLAPPAGAAGVNPHLAFLGAPMVAERLAADEVKQNAPVLAIIGNPPYKRLRKGEVNRLVGRAMSEMWEDLKRPVRAAGFGLSLNAFPDLAIAFYRWALWRLFEAPGARGRGTLAFITNRTFLTATGYGGLRQMLRNRFDQIRIIDFRGGSRNSLPATLTRDENVFQIKVGVCVLIAHASGEPQVRAEGEVSYASVWREGAFTRADKLAVASEAAANPDTFTFQVVPGGGMGRFKPAGFLEQDWPSLAELFEFRSNGVVTYRDSFAYATQRETLSARLLAFLDLPPAEAEQVFKTSALNTSARAQTVAFDPNAIEAISYRPLDLRNLYNHPQYVDRQRPDLVSSWGPENVALMALSSETGGGPAVWCHSQKPDQHAFRGSYGGWIFPLVNPAPEGEGHFIKPEVIDSLSASYGRAVGPQEVFDVALAMLSATSYTTTFAHDLEDDFPHVPFPAEAGQFVRAATIGRRIRELQSHRSEAAGEFQGARLDGEAGNQVLDIAAPRRAFVGEGGRGTIALVSDQSLRIVDVSERAWEFSVSGYQVLYKWLKAREGEFLHGAGGVALLRSSLSVVWRIEELLSLFDAADAILRETGELALTRVQVGVPERPAGADMFHDDDAE
jgi:hypothetical protein